MRDLVSIRRCERYDRALLVDAMCRCLNDIGGFPASMRPGQRVYLKPNLLRPAPPGSAVTTHPDVVYAAAKILVDAGYGVVIGDAPAAGTPFTERGLRRAYAACGFDRAAEDAGAELNYDIRMTQVDIGQDALVHRMPICTPAVEADHIVSLPKAKTHVYTALTGAVKNLYGLIHGWKKTGYHASLPDRERFARMLVDLCARFRPALSFVDAVECMEGDGPGSGDPRAVGALLASTNPFKLDHALCRLLGIEPERVTTVVQSGERGFLEGGYQLRGDAPESFGVKDFRMPRSAPPMGMQGPRIPTRLAKRLYRAAFLLRPKVRKKLCTGCGKCEKGCPVKAIRIVKKKSEIDDSICIRCYCCHEVCPERAIYLRESLLFRLVSRIT